LDEIFDFLNSVMPVRLLVGVPKHQLIEKIRNIGKRNIFSFVSFLEWSQQWFLWEDRAKDGKDRDRRKRVTAFLAGTETDVDSCTAWWPMPGFASKQVKHPKNQKN